MAVQLESSVTTNAALENEKNQIGKKLSELDLENTFLQNTIEEFEKRYGIKVSQPPPKP